MRYLEPPVLKGPVLGLGLGFVAGSAEALKLSYTLLLELGFGEAFLGASACILLNGLLGAVLGVVGGVAALVGAYFLGPRLGRFRQRADGSWEVVRAV